MNRIGFVLKVKADKIEEYKVQHCNVWPEMQLAQLLALFARRWVAFWLF
jgi:L-rhamnose mutarotase